MAESGMQREAQWNDVRKLVNTIRYRVKSPVISNRTGLSVSSCVNSPQATITNYQACEKEVAQKELS